jgi:hypothetical protein
MEDIEMGETSHSGWHNRTLARLYHELEQVRADLSDGGMSTARGCISTALSSIELADEYVGKFNREEEQ